ncbi:MAG TPA: MFS transporter [Stellaceae bacterium]|nr:MFS transporter [Stellaceae bacterium]
MAALDRARSGLTPAQLFTCLVLLWLSGAGLRLTLLAVPPVIPLIHADLALTETEIGALGSLPSLLFALAAVPGALLIARLGARATLIAGLLLTALGSAARGAAPDVVVLYLATGVMGAGIAVMQPALPPLVRAWLPDRIGFATAVYSNGLLVSETLAVALTIPFVLPLVGGSWRWSFVVWSLPVLLTAVLVWALAPREAEPVTAALRRWWPDWRNPLVWRLALMLGGVNTVYFATNTFLPDYLGSLGRGDLINPALTALNLAQLPASFAMLAWTGSLATRHWPYVAAGLTLVASVLGMTLLGGVWIVVFAGVLGCINAAVLVMLLALPALLAAPQEVHRVSAAMFTMSYPCAVMLTIIGGGAWDLTGLPIVAFVPVGLGAAAIAALAPGIEFAHLAR